MTILSTTSDSRPAVLDLPLLLPPLPGSQAERLHAGLRDAILDGRLAPGLRLPSSRSLAGQLGLRRNVVVVAYEHLLGDGLVEARIGAGTYVAAGLPTGSAPARPSARPLPLPRQTPFAIGRTLPDATLLRQFGSLLRRHLAGGDPSHFGYGDPLGDEALRRALATHLAATRGLFCDPDCILITSGTRQALRLCAEVLLRAGDGVWVEDPGYPAARGILEAVGARPLPVPVDRAGLDVAAGRTRAPGARLAYVTPSHQFPTGVTMSMDRRLALLDWARAADAWVLEDDYDSEFRFAGPPLTALAGIDRNGRVIYVGTFSKTLFPGLRLGYMVAPPALVARIAAARAALDSVPPSLPAAAVAELLTGGAFAAHVRRMRRRYRAARDLVAETLAATAGAALRVEVPDQGLHLLALLPTGLPPGIAAAIRAAAEVEAWLLSETRLAPGGPEGFVLGYSGHAPADLREAAERLGRAARSGLPG